MSLDAILRLENQLINGCKSNDRKSQETVYKRYFDKMFVMCKRYTQDEDQICLIINDAFLTVFKNIHKFEFRGSFEGWIRKITFNTLSDHFRKENKNIKFLLLEEQEYAFQSHCKPEQDDAYDDIIAKINTLKGVFKDVFIKYAIEGYNHKEIGQKLSISEGTSKWYLSEARKKLQTLFNDQQSSMKYGQ